MQQAGVAWSEQVWRLRRVPALCGAVLKQAGGERGEHAWLLVSGVLVQPYGVSRSVRSEVKRLPHEVQGCRPCVTCAATNKRTLLSPCCSGRCWRGKRTRFVEMPSEESRGRLDGKLCNATKTSETQSIPLQVCLLSWSLVLLTFV